MSELLSLFFLLQSSDIQDSILFYRAYDAYNLENFEEAEGTLLRHLISYPDSRYNAKTLFLLADINFKTGRYQKVIEYCLSLIKKYPDFDTAIHVLLMMGDAYFNLQRFTSAKQVYKRLKKLPLPPEILQRVDLRIHEIAYYEGKFSSLTDALRDFIETYVDTTKSGGIISETMLRIARLHMEKKEYYSALSMLKRLKTTYPESHLLPEVLFEESRINKYLGNVEEYKNSLSLIVTNWNKHPLFPSALIELATSYQEEQKFDSSLYYWTLLKNISGYQDLALKGIADIYYKINFYDEAIVVLQTLIKEFPESKLTAEAYLLWAEILKSQGEDSKAIDILNELSKKSDLKPEIFVKLGEMYYKLNDYQDALRCYLKASENYKEQRDEAARALIKAGDVAKAMGDKVGAKRYYLNARQFAQSVEIKHLAAIKINEVD